MNKILFTIITISVLLFTLKENVHIISDSKNNIGKDGSSWKFNLQMAKYVYEDAKGEFGYFIFSPDLFGYSPKYAFSYFGRRIGNTKVANFEKRKITYLIIAPPPKDRLFLNGEWWKEEQVKITKKPIFVKKYSNGFKIEKYLLDKDDLMIGADPNLIRDLYFR